MVKIWKVIIYGIVISFLAVSLGNSFGLDASYQTYRTRMVEEKMKEFEERLKNGEPVEDLEDYEQLVDTDYSNVVSKAGLNASKTIENATKAMFRKLFEFLNDSIGD